MAKSQSTAGSLSKQVLLDNPEFLRDITESVIREILEMEMTAHVGAEPYQRTSARSGHRNGYKDRTLFTRVGTLSLRVPQDREGTFSSQIFARYQRNEKALVLALMEMYLNGVSTRKVTEITETLCGTSFSKSLVSSLTSSLDAELSSWRSRPLTTKAYPYLCVDARYENVRDGGEVISRGALIVSAVRDDGKREILTVDIADTESEATYHELFRNLKGRGLSGVRLVTSDDHKGLRAAIRRHFQGAAWQRCQVHFRRNLCGMVSYSRRAELSQDLDQIFAISDPVRAREALRQVAAKWEKINPKVAAHIDESIEHCLAYLVFPSSHHKRIRTTNGLERLNQEFKRRTRVVRIFPNRESCLRLITALAMETSEEWITGKRYLDMEKLTEGSEVRRESQECELAVAK